MNEDTIDLNVKILDKLTHILKGKIPMARVGVLGKNSRSDTRTATNSQIGAKHELGLDGLPMRSFLRMPIAEHLAGALEKAGLYKKGILETTLREGTLVDLMKKIGVLGEGIVQDAFDSGGFGKWKPSNMDRKKVKQTLVETQQLRNAISSDVR